MLKRAWVQDPNQELRVLLLKVLPDSGIGPFDGNFLIQLNKPHDGFIEMNITKIVDSDYTTDFVGFVNVYCQIQTKQGQKRLDRAVNIEIIRLNTSTRLSDHVKLLTVLSTFDGLLSSGPLLV